MDTCLAIFAPITRNIYKRKCRDGMCRIRERKKYWKDTFHEDIILRKWYIDFVFFKFVTYIVEQGFQKLLLFWVEKQAERKQREKNDINKNYT